MSELVRAVESGKIARPTVAVWKFASCDGCQLTLLDCEAELLAVADAVDLAFFPEAGPERELDHYDLSLVEGSITTAADAERIRMVRERSGLLVTIGACATSGGIQSLRNLADVDAYRAVVYARPDWIDTLATSTAIADHVHVDHELRGCPISKTELLALLAALLAGRRPPVDTHAVCTECKATGTTCLVVARSEACLGPVTHAGCGALCPRFGRGCFGCFGPSESANVASLGDRLGELGVTTRDLVAALRTFNAAAPVFAQAAARLEQEPEGATP